MTACIIYAIIAPDGRKYVGQTRSGFKRLFNHLTQLRQGKHFNSHMQRVYNQSVSWEWSIAVLEDCKEADLNEREVYWINFYDTFDPLKGFNKREGGGSGRWTVPRSADGVAKWKQKMVGRKLPDEVKAKLRGKRKPQDPEWIQKRIASRLKTLEARKTTA